MNLLPFILFTLCTMSAAQAQPGSRFTFFGQSRVVSPQVYPDGRVTFRLMAPHAKQVYLELTGTKPQAMQQEADQVWSLTTPKLEPDVYPYRFTVDGVSMPDPSNPTLAGGYKITVGQSLVHVPGDSALPWEMTNVPHGNVIHHRYQSAIIGDNRDYYVYTPPGYDPNRKQPYTGLFLLHGLTENAATWNLAGRANFILDNLIAQQKAEPMLVVSPLGYGDPADIIKGVGGPFEKFTQSLLNEVIPQLEKDYHVTKEASGRAVTGLSMGGGQSLFMGLNHPDTFHYIGGFSPAVVMYGLNRDGSTVKDPRQLVDAPLFQRVFPRVSSQLNQQIKLLWIGSGVEDGEIKYSAEFKHWLSANQVKYTEVMSPGGHTWLVWKRHLIQFVPLLFR